MLLEPLLNGLRAVGESTRLRLLAILANNDLTVSELTRILGQSQPRVSRHLKLLCEAGLLERYQEGTWVFYRLVDHGRGAEFSRAIMALLSRDDLELARDFERLEAVRQDRARAATKYFQDNAVQWDRIRALHVSESKIEKAMLAAVSTRDIGNLLDLGTGTGRILQAFSPRIRNGFGMDLSHEMLAMARSKLDSENLRHCQIRRGDIYNIPLPAGCMDVVTIHHVLHFLDEPARAIAEAARVLRPSGYLLIADFAPHELKFLCTEYAHRRLGFTDAEMIGWCVDEGLERTRVEHLSTNNNSQLTVSLWVAEQRAAAPEHCEKVVAW